MEFEHSARPVRAGCPARYGTSLLVLRGVWKSFAAGVPGCSASARVLAGVSLMVREGEVVGLAGGAGAGKSTLLYCAAGILRPEYGLVEWPEHRKVSHEAAHPTAHQAARQVARHVARQAAHPAAHGALHGSAAGVAESGPLAYASRLAPARPLYLDLRAASCRRELRSALAGGVPLILADHVAGRDLDHLRAAIVPSLRARSSRPCPAIVLAGRNGVELARVASRVLVLRGGRLRARAPCVAGSGCFTRSPPSIQRNRSAARTSSEFPAALARASMRSTWGRSVRSPQ